MKTMQFKVYGADGHRQAVSFQPSKEYDWSIDGKTRIVKILNADKTGTNEYTIVEITRNTEDQCWDEIWGQVTDGIFEDHRVGKVEAF